MEGYAGFHAHCGVGAIIIPTGPLENSNSKGAKERYYGLCVGALVTKLIGKSTLPGLGMEALYITSRFQFPFNCPN